ncbi:MAG TPA: hypothetical protein VF008_28570 [Niastella sp.]
MKKIFTLAAILFSITTFAAGNPRPDDSKIAIRSNSDAFIQVFVDGKQYNMNRNGFVMDNIRSGRHRIEVYKVENYGMYRRRPQLVYSSTTFVKPWESLNININRFEKVWVDTRFDRNDRRGNDRNYGRDRDYNDGRDYNNGPDRNDRDGRYKR